MTKSSKYDKSLVNDKYVMPYYVYIISNTKLAPLYIGVTNNLEKRIYEHKNKLISGSFSSKYNLSKLLYWERGQDIDSCIKREKQLKNWHRQWKLNLIKTTNPNFKDLSEYPNFVDPETSSG
jgi:putative endonuclease